MISNEEVHAAHNGKAVLKAHSAHEEAVNKHEAAKAAVAKAEQVRERAYRHHVELQRAFQRGDLGSDQQQLARASVVVEAGAHAVRLADEALHQAHADVAAHGDALRVAERSAKSAVTAALAPLAERGIVGRIAAAARYDAAMAEARAAEADYETATAAVRRAQVEGFEVPATANLHASLSPQPSPELRKIAEQHRAERYNPAPASLEAHERAMWGRAAA